MTDSRHRTESSASRRAAKSPLATASPAPVAQSVLELVGRTPLVRLSRMEPPAGASVWGKAEFMNPAGSVKDRPALSMIEAAEKSGRLEAGATLVEATSGNTGISLAMIAAVRGYRCILVMPEDMSLERRHIMRAYGAEIALTPATDGMIAAVRQAETIVRDTPGAFMPSQFENPANPEAHYAGTANELIEQLAGRIDVFVAGVGTGGTITGVARRLRERLDNKVHVVAVEPKGSPVLSGGKAGLHAIQGLGAGFIPSILDRSVIDEIVTVSDVAAERAARRLAQSEGLLVGPSAGANVHVACTIAQRLSSGNVVTVLCDSGERYLF
jgi:cysteine synthase A